MDTLKWLSIKLNKINYHSYFLYRTQRGITAESCSTSKNRFNSPLSWFCWRSIWRAFKAVPSPLLSPTLVFATSLPAELTMAELPVSSSTNCRRADKIVLMDAAGSKIKIWIKRKRLFAYNAWIPSYTKLNYKIHAYQVTLWIAKPSRCYSFRWETNIFPSFWGKYRPHSLHQKDAENVI